MTQPQPSQRLSAFLVLLCLLNSVHSDSGLNISRNYANLSEAFPPLSALYTTHLEKSPYLGGQNFTQCCLKAVSLSYVMQDGQPIQNPNKALDFLKFPPNSLSQGQFPCGAAYTGDHNGAEPVLIPYSWCKQNCGGWQKSTNAALSQWVQPLVGFILPAAVFCLNVPRKSVFGIPDDFFIDHFADLPGHWRELLIEWAFLFARFLDLINPNWKPKWVRDRTGGSKDDHDISKAITKFIGFFVTVFVSLLVMVCRATFAAAIGLINTMIWVAVVFSTAGPMIMSGVYEASLDRKIITSILQELKIEREENEKKGETKKEGVGPKGKIGLGAQQALFYKRIHQLYVVLVGNLKLPRTKEDIPEPLYTVWKDVNNLVKPPELLTKLPEHANQSTEEHVDRKSKEQVNVTSEDCVEPNDDEQFLPNSEYRKITETRLKGMLGCQASFGAAVGAPVVFFVGSFLFGVISNLTVVGDNDTAHALAFGQWWMTIPHVAIVSGCLLAGNNPNTLEVIVASLRKGPSGENDTPGPEGFRKVYQPFYRSIYVPVEMWARGRTKQAWIDRLLIKYGPSPYSTDVEGKGKKGEFHLTPMDWVFLVAITSSLMVLPFVLAFLTSYYTPAIGLSCRTLTFLLYFVFQVLFGIVWVSDFFFRFRRTRHIKRLPFAFKKGKTKEEGNGKEKEKEDGAKNGSADRKESTKRRNAPTCFGLLLTFLVLGSLFTTVVGTFLQILGVYRNCLCDIPIGSWRNGDFTLAISTNTKDDIYFATKFWLPTGVASIVLLIVVCYIGWWYQRHWRSQFRVVVQQLLYPEASKEPERKAESILKTNDSTKGAIFEKRSADGSPLVPTPAEKKEPETTTTENKDDEITQG